MFGPLLLFIWFITWPTVLSLKCFVGDCSQEDIFDQGYMCYFARDEKRNLEMCGGYHKVESKSIKDGDCLLNQVVDNGYGRGQSMSTQCFCDYHLCNVKSYFPAFSNSTIVKRNPLFCYQGYHFKDVVKKQKEQCKENEVCFYEYMNDTGYEYFACAVPLHWCKKDGDCDVELHGNVFAAECCCNTHLCNTKSYFPILSNGTIVKQERWCYDGTLVIGKVYDTMKKVKCGVFDMCFYQYVNNRRVGEFGCATTSIIRGAWCIGKNGSFCEETEKNIIRCCCNTEDLCNLKWIPPVKQWCYDGVGCKEQVGCNGICYYARDERKNKDICGCSVYDNWCEKFNTRENECKFGHYAEIPYDKAEYAEFCCCQGDKYCNKKTNIPKTDRPKTPEEVVVKGVEKCFNYVGGHVGVQNCPSTIKYCQISFNPTENNAIWPQGTGCGGCEEVGCKRGHQFVLECCCDTKMCNDMSLLDQMHLPDSDHKYPDHNPNDKNGPYNKASKIGLAWKILMMMVFIFGIQQK